MTQAERNEPLTDYKELLFRQIHPSFIHDGRVTSQAFKPTPKDEHQLSVDRESLVLAQAAFHRYTNDEGYISAGVMGVTVGECKNNGLPAYPAPVPPSATSKGNPSHAQIDFSEIPSENQREKRAKKLARCARARGWLYNPGFGDSGHRDHGHRGTALDERALDAETATEGEEDALEHGGR